MSAREPSSTLTLHELRERGAVGALSVMLPAVDQHLLRTSLRKTVRRLDRISALLQPVLGGRAAELSSLQSLHRRARRLALYEPDCLADSLCAFMLLRARGYEPCLRLGVRSVSGHVEAHAWVEVGDEVFNDDPDIASRYELLQPDAWTTWREERD